MTLPKDRFTKEIASDTRKQKSLGLNKAHVLYSWINKKVIILTTEEYKEFFLTDEYDNYEDCQFLFEPFNDFTNCYILHIKNVTCNSVMFIAVTNYNKEIAIRCQYNAMKNNKNAIKYFIYNITCVQEITQQVKNKFNEQR